jgi:hypothetical protein
MDFELQRRGQPCPVIPATPPHPTEGAKVRAAATLSMKNNVVGGGAYE